MLVCAEACGDVEACLLAAGCWVVKLRDGAAAVSLAEREMFDGAVLVSTGKEMDLPETVFNLSDIRSSMQIIIVSDGFGAERGLDAREIVARAVPNARVLTLKGLKRMFESE